MKITSILFIYISLCMPLVLLSEESRVWTSSVGTSIEAVLLEVNGDQVVLKRADGKKFKLKLHQLSMTDRDYLAQLKPPEKSTQKSINVAGQELIAGSRSEAIKCKAKREFSYRVYLPEQFDANKAWPVCFIMSPNGGANGGALNSYKAGADKLGVILALSVESKNGFEDSEFATEAMLKDVYKRFPVIKGLAFSTGFSGGSRHAYLLAERSREIAGVLACGSGDGVYVKGEGFRDSKLRKSTYVYSLVGSNCFNRSGTHKSHLDFPDHYRLRFFPGNHEWAKSPYLEEGLARVLGEALKKYKGDEQRRLIEAYLSAMTNWATEMVTDQPWEAKGWIEFLLEFPVNASIRSKLQAMLKTVDANAQTKIGIDAEKAIRKFRKKYFNLFYKEDQKPNSARTSEAQRLSEKYKGTPYMELIRRLGNKS